MSTAHDDERFAEYLDGQMVARVRERFEAELRVNRGLEARLDEYRLTVETVRRALAETGADEPSGDRALTERILAAVAMDRAPRADRRRMLPLFSSFLAAAALVAAFFALEQLPGGPGEPPPATRQAADAPADLDALALEEAEQVLEEKVAFGEAERVPERKAKIQARGFAKDELGAASEPQQVRLKKTVEDTVKGDRVAEVPPQPDLEVGAVEVLDNQRELFQLQLDARDQVTLHTASNNSDSFFLGLRAVEEKDRPAPEETVAGLQLVVVDLPAAAAGEPENRGRFRRTRVDDKATERAAGEQPAPSRRDRGGVENRERQLLSEELRSLIGAGPDIESFDDLLDSIGSQANVTPVHARRIAQNALPPEFKIPLPQALAGGGGFIAADTTAYAFEVVGDRAQMGQFLRGLTVWSQSQGAQLGLLRVPAPVVAQLDQKLAADPEGKRRPEQAQAKSSDGLLSPTAPPASGPTPPRPVTGGQGLGRVGADGVTPSANKPAQSPQIRLLIVLRRSGR